MIEEARALDAADPLASFRDQFVISDPEVIYLDGNSLGRMPKAAAEVFDRLKLEWGDRLVRGWGEGWYDLPQRLGAKVARLLGVEADEVIVCDSTSVNLYKLVLATLDFNNGKRAVISDETNFPSDLYVLRGGSKQAWHWIISLRPGPDGFVPADEFVRTFTLHKERSALLSLSHTAFKSGHIHPMAFLTEEAHKVGALALWTSAIRSERCRSSLAALAWTSRSDALTSISTVVLARRLFCSSGAICRRSSGIRFGAGLAAETLSLLRLSICRPTV
jgi:kynureninase